ncbi:DNA polymerase III subunit gamma/tau [Treponema pectinovorum]|uniref:DNA polymerase III subunit gamma/tau n=1 Tax=Treponema pectinovorum TaxID=164 RepID=UPI0011CA85D8|nr:DNA polymerase III subunit gamma/tau [Treponema pectinovorum]
MSYEVTATRRRPQKFEDLVGQEFVAETFRNAIQSKKIAHAYLFSGPRGCGKTSTARILAKSLNCAEGPIATPCGHCQQCMEITKGSCTDVIEIDGASNTSVNDVRQIKDEVLFPPQSCRYKIYIIDEVHMLSTSAFNALLKTIEEPPPYVIFIFATTELQKVPATIKSRCQQFNFRLVPIEKVKEQLSLAAKEIGVKAEDEALYWIARESTGSMRDAYTLFDQVAAFSADEITYDKIRDKLGLVGVDRLNEIFEECVNNKTKLALEKLDSFLQAGISIDLLISNATDYLRSLLLIKNGITKEALLGQNAERYSSKVLERWNSVQIERALSLFLNLYREIRYSLNPRYELELAFSRLCWLNQYVSVAEVKNAIDKAKSLLLSKNDFRDEDSVSQQNFVQNQNAQPQKPAHFFAQDIEDAKRQESFTKQNENAQRKESFAEQNENPQRKESFAEQNENSQSFIKGGAEPPEQTAKVQEPIRDMAQLKKAVLSKLSVSEKTAILATTLIQTGNWILQGNEISTVVASAFTQNQLHRQISEISDIISTFYGSPISFNVSVKQAVQINDTENAPKEVQLLCALFRGEIVSKGEKVESAKPEEKSQGFANSDEAENSNDETENTNFELSIQEDEDESV